VCGDILDRHAAEKELNEYLATGGEWELVTQLAKDEESLPDDQDFTNARANLESALGSYGRAYEHNQTRDVIVAAIENHLLAKIIASNSPAWVRRLYDSLRRSARPPEKWDYRWLPDATTPVEEIQKRVDKAPSCVCFFPVFYPETKYPQEDGFAVKLRVSLIEKLDGEATLSLAPWSKLIHLFSSEHEDGVILLPELFSNPVLFTDSALQFMNDRRLILELTPVQWTVPKSQPARRISTTGNSLGLSVALAAWAASMGRRLRRLIATGGLEKNQGEAWKVVRVGRIGLQGKRKAVERLAKKRRSHGQYPGDHQDTLGNRSLSRVLSENQKEILFLVDIADAQSPILKAEPQKGFRINRLPKARNLVPFKTLDDLFDAPWSDYLLFDEFAHYEKQAKKWKDTIRLAENSEEDEESKKYLATSLIATLGDSPPKRAVVQSPYSNISPEAARQVVVELLDRGRRWVVPLAIGHNQGDLAENSHLVASVIRTLRDWGVTELSRTAIEQAFQHEVVWLILFDDQIAERDAMESALNQLLSRKDCGRMLLRLVTCQWRIPFGCLQKKFEFVNFSIRD
jgi:hypothetical protein